MNNKRLLHTNIIISFIIIIGFIATSIVSYRSNMGLYGDNIEHVSTLASDGLFYKIESVISKPLHVSLTMSDDSFFKDYLKSEHSNLNNSDYEKTLANYLNVYKEKYNYETAFFVSAASSKFYLYDGSTHYTQTDAPKDKWYYSFLNSDFDTFLNVNQDLEDNDASRIFVNCKMKASDGSVLGVVGIGFDIREVQDILTQYNEEYQVSAYLTDPSGTVQLPYDSSRKNQPNLLDDEEYASYNELLTTDTTDLHGDWFDTGQKSGYISARYLNNLGWNLIVSKNTEIIRQEFTDQLLKNILIIILILVTVILIISKLIRH